MDANERKTGGDVANRPERNRGRKDTVHLALNVDRNDASGFEKSRQIDTILFVLRHVCREYQSTKYRRVENKNIAVWEVLCNLLKYHRWS